MSNVTIWALFKFTNNSKYFTTFDFREVELIFEKNLKELTNKTLITKN